MHGEPVETFDLEMCLRMKIRLVEWARRRFYAHVFVVAPRQIFKHFANNFMMSQWKNVKKVF